jgi:hypothetical protein
MQLLELQDLSMLLTRFVIVTMEQWHVWRHTISKDRWCSQYWEATAPTGGEWHSSQPSTHTGISQTVLFYFPGV